MKLEQLNEFFPHLPYGVYGLLFQWAEWRSTAGCPRSALPTPAYRWHFRGGELTAEPGFCLERATRRTEPLRMMEVSRAFLGLSHGHQVVLMALINRQDKAFPRGKEWTIFLTNHGLTAKQYRILLGDALTSFAGMATAKRMLAA